ncbi:ubiquitin-like modifier-activating enzyme ATG7 [Limulus polyphemus]|uniref:Ubiquitin-like modifier-activating enzyme ATG7 n=1 Tax=Limulus polyphemus TaxID=6850 RepID=A0ABM1B610_LIMPO|nr:ubiquitin-like modifier-activating enzyme ATG7 [Limulus polyphemus]XP_022242798.1 ubiquitin-like modifier-activating enzyme ATG7 [Limulus polyphemus]
MDSEEKLLQFAPFSSCLDPGFWYQLTQRKVNIYKLDDSPVSISGFYSNGEAPGLPVLANIDYTAFDGNRKAPAHQFTLMGTLYNTNILDEFKQKDKQKLILDFGKQIWSDIKSGKALKKPSSTLSLFLAVTFADLKRYVFYYWFAYPALIHPEKVVLLSPPLSLQNCFTADQIIQLQCTYDLLEDPEDRSYFLVHINEAQSITVRPLREYLDLKNEPGKLIVGFADPCTLKENPGWPLRNLLALVSYHWGKDRSEWEVLCFRDRVKDGKRSSSHSLLLQVKLCGTMIPNDAPLCVGWEKNEKQKLGPRHVDLSSSMNPKRLAESAVELNLRLMRWRLVPSLDLEKITSTKCLLLGAGTLGCNVGRCLLSWGVKHITFVDNARVSFSNPVRQSLFTFESCLDGGELKAEAAANGLRRIFPGIVTQGINLSIPMPGHPVNGKLIEQIKQDVEQLEDLVETHDVVFLLMDTRESRWLPTVLGALKQKIVFSVALGFDTFLVLRHGMKSKDSNSGVKPMSLDGAVPGDQLGCYFCNDVVAPGNSTRDRTLDQQCTVTRPGVSMVASALAVELLVSLLQHPRGPLAEAETSSWDQNLTVESESPLGIIPHQIRGFLSRFHHILPASIAFNQCTACSHSVLDMYKREGYDFLLKVFNEPNYLEDLTGLKKLHEETNSAEVWVLSDNESM